MKEYRGYSFSLDYLISPGSISDAFLTLAFKLIKKLSKYKKLILYKLASFLGYNMVFHWMKHYIIRTIIIK